jgi:tRNA1(Val) A37 N6-methylase TrmN6
MTLTELFPGGLTNDTILGGRVKIAQPVGGYRVAVDPVLLAASVRATAGQTVADLGCGTGAVGLCLAQRVQDCRVIALEKQPDLALLSATNVATNGLAERVSVVVGDVSSLPLRAGSLDHVVMNPPYLASGTASAPANRLRHVAAVEGEAGLAEWLRAGLALLRPKGSLTLVHRADRLDQIIGMLGALQRGGMSVLPISASSSAPAHRVIVWCEKGSAKPFTLLPPLVLHRAEGGFTPAAERVLRDSWSLDDALGCL